MEVDLEDCIWGRVDWQDYVKKIITASTLNEAGLLERIEVVKSNVGRQIRKAVEQHHPRLVEQASALHGLDIVQGAISREMSHLFTTSEELSNRYDTTYRELYKETYSLEQLYVLKRILYAAYRCEQLIRRLCTVNEIVKQSEMISEMESIIAEFPQIKEISWLKESIVVTAPKLVSEARQRTVKQLKSSLESLNTPLVTSCVRALHNLSRYEIEVKALLDEYIRELDADFLQLTTSLDSAGKQLLLISSKVQGYLEQLVLLGDESVSYFSKGFAQIVSNRIPTNLQYSCRFLQLFTPIFSQFSSNDVEKVFEAFRPLKTAILSQSLNRMFITINSAFEDSSMRNSIVEKVSNALRKELCSVEWDVDLKREMEENLSKAIEFSSQKIEELLKLDEESLLIGERISNVQNSNYSLMNVAYALNKAWPKYSGSLMHVARQARDAIVSVAKTSVSKILQSMHSEPLGSPSPYAKELCDYVGCIRIHLSAMLSLTTSDRTLESLADYIIDLFLIHASLYRPTSKEELLKLGDDLKLLHRALKTFDVETPLLTSSPSYADALSLSWEELVSAAVPTTSDDHPTALTASLKVTLPAWTVVQLLISYSDSSLLSPYDTIGSSLQQYAEWFHRLSLSERLKFLSSVIESYSSSVVSQNCAEYVPTYPLIIGVLKRSLDYLTEVPA
uniref:Conserved oligomeric Golgi complex subunit 5 n=1 Tax=Syphacia muris TaxID=451379 RepID=A0A0N5A9Z9_9BILA